MTFILRIMVLALLACAPVTSQATVTSSTRTAGYTPSTSTTVFSVPFYFLEKAHLRVTKTLISSGVGTVLTQDADYTVTLPVGSTLGFVTTFVGVTSTHTLTIDRIMPITQETSFAGQGRFRAATHEDAFDKLTMIIQGLPTATAVAGDIDGSISTHEGLPDPHTGYAKLAGRAGSQVLNGGTAAGEDLEFVSTAHGTKGHIKIGSNIWIASDGKMGVGGQSPDEDIEVDGTIGVFGASDGIVIDGDVGIRTFGGLDDILTIKAWNGTTDGASATLYDITHFSDPGLMELGAATFEFYDTTGADLYATLVTTGMTMDTNGDFLVTGTGAFDGPTHRGGTGAGDNITITSTEHATKGDIFLGTGAEKGTYDETLNLLGLKTTAPEHELDVRGQAAFRRPWTTATTYAPDMAGDCNTVDFNNLDGGTFTLPDTTSVVDDQSACVYTLINRGTTAATQIDLLVDAAHRIYGTCGSVTWTGIAGQDARHTKATAKRGEYITVIAQETDKAYYIVGCSGTWDLL